MQHTRKYIYFTITFPHYGVGHEIYNVLFPYHTNATVWLRLAQ